jgi:hypothetical protein
LIPRKHYLLVGNSTQLVGSITWLAKIASLLTFHSLEIYRLPFVSALHCELTFALHKNYQGVHSAKKAAIAIKAQSATKRTP